MVEHFGFESLFVLPFVLAVVFLVWVLWKLSQQTKR